MDLFVEKQTTSAQRHAPLADRMRPQNLNQFVGQKHLVGPGKILRKIIEEDNPISLIFWGPPGTGKTTLARIIANETQAVFYAISAVTAGVKDVRKVIDQAKVNQRGLGKRSLLFIDEIHRFNKAQQDALLHSVEDGTLILIGATTENPSFEVISPLLSRCRVLKLEMLTVEEIQSIIDHALSEDRRLKESHIVLSDDVKKTLIRLSSGDARIALSGLELCSQLASEKNGKKVVTVEIVQEAMQKRALFYDKQGDLHYDTISAFIKSVRGSDPDAAVYWMARMLESGEDPLFIARRLVILASEDIGNADPHGLMIANAAFQAVHAVGMPEARIILSQAATYLASAPKSNAAYVAISEASETVRNTAPEPVPLHLRNPVTKLMKEMDYGKAYQYAHHAEDGFVEQEHLPNRLKDRIFYRPKEIGEEKIIKQRLKGWWKKRRKSDNQKRKEP